MSGFELVLDKSAVQTPRQMYANLTRAGYCVQYKCAPACLPHTRPLLLQRVLQRTRMQAAFPLSVLLSHCVADTVASQACHASASFRVN